MKTSGQTNFRQAFVMMIILFFLFGFVTAINGVLQPVLKDIFQLNNFQANLVTFSFFAGFLVTSPVASAIIARWGYKRAIVAGLSLVGIGMVIFYLASVVMENLLNSGTGNASSNLPYVLFLLGVFFVGSGVATIQVAANPYLAVLGPIETADSRINTAGFFNSIASMSGPMILGAYLLKDNLTSEIEKVASIQEPYIALIAASFIMALGFSFISLPKLSTESSSDEKVEGNPLKYRHMWSGVLAIFVYVGAEVSIGNNLIQLIDSAGESFAIALKKETFVSAYWGSLMIGRLAGIFIMRKVKTSYGLLFTSLMALLLTVGGLLTDINTAIWFFVAIGLFNSVMWGAIFPLGIAKMGKLTNKASGYMMMGVFGGALIPLLHGLVADAIGSMHLAYGIVLVSYGYLFYYSTIGCKVISHPEEA